MRERDIRHFRDQLIQLRSRLVLRAGQRLEGDEHAGADGVPDFADYAVERAEIAVDDRIAESEANLVEKIDLALSRLDEGTYDKCAGCGEQIPLERLRAKPTVSLCVSCQEAKEVAGS